MCTNINFQIFFYFFRKALLNPCKLLFLNQHTSAYQDRYVYVRLKTSHMNIELFDYRLIFIFKIKPACRAAATCQSRLTGTMNLNSLDGGQVSFVFLLLWQISAIYSALAIEFLLYSICSNKAR